jgi:ABC-type bacteriocin/lantibiotic exporter with double-glycine peptidase domain
MILATSAEHGVRLEAWRLSADTLGQIHPPAILWIDGDHFVVFDSLSETGAHLRDPASGRAVVRMERLLQRWDGTAAVAVRPP